MALLDSGRPHRDILPPINHPDFERIRSDKIDRPRFSIMPGLSIKTAHLESPTTIYSGPPPPYSKAPSANGSIQEPAGYFSPPLSTTRRSTRDDKELPTPNQLPSLPSLHEALGGDKSMPYSGPPSARPSAAPTSALAGTVGQNFPDGARGPPNPFSHTSSLSSATTGHSQADALSSKPAVSSYAPHESTSHIPQPYSSPGDSNKQHRNSLGSFSNTSRPPESLNGPPSFTMETNGHPHSCHEHVRHPPPSAPNAPHSFSFDPAVKFDESRNPFIRPPPQQPYGDTIKRHLEFFDAELALNEISGGSSRVLDFSTSWSQRYHQANRMSHITETGPSLQEIDDMISQQQRTMDNLTRIRDFVHQQQMLLSEQRARAAQGHMDNDYHNLPDDYKSGGFAGGDAKKRRGKAAPPGRCHSCNRAETPEWRRGPDGARTLCNACGLHYAKLTRKLGANKAGTLTGSNLRPKGLDPRSPHI